MQADADRLAAAYAFCLQMAATHYENFPVASRLLPRPLRVPVAVVYAFARRADDIADEGDLPAPQRLAALDDLTAGLNRIEAGAPVDDPIFLATADVIARYRLPIGLFHDLVSAFRQDVTQHRYHTFDEVLDYCRRSANPVGRLLLHLNDAASETNLQLSDRICTALQLINFYQDLAQDYDENGRIYLPVAEMRHYRVGDEHFRERRNDEALRRLLRLQYDRCRALLLAGAPLGQRLHGRFGLEIRAIVAGGMRVLERLEQQLPVAPFARPRLRRRDWLLVAWRTLTASLPGPRRR